MTDPRGDSGWIAEQGKHDGRGGLPRRELLAQPTLDGTIYTVGYLLGIIRAARDRGIMLPHFSELGTFLQRRERELREEWETSGGSAPEHVGLPQPEGGVGLMYLIAGRWTAQAHRDLVRNPHDNTPRARELVERVGGSLVASYYNTGEWDYFLVVNVETPTVAQAIREAIAEAGNVERIEIRQMLTTEQFLEALSAARGQAASMNKP